MTYVTGKSNGDVAGMKQRLDQHDWIIGVVLVVLLMSFATMFVTLGGYIMQYEANKQATYQNLVDKVTEQSLKIDNLSITDGK